MCRIPPSGDGSRILAVEQQTFEFHRQAFRLGGIGFAREPKFDRGRKLGPKDLHDLPKGVTRDPGDIVIDFTIRRTARHAARLDETPLTLPVVQAIGRLR